MRKDVLTYEKIRKDLHQVYVSGYVCLGIFIVFTALFVWLTIICRNAGGVVGIYSVLFFVLSILSVVAVISIIVQLPKWYKLSTKKPIMVVDKLVGKDVEYPVNSSYAKLCFYFSGYGRYEMILDELNKKYTWSENFAMTPQRIYDRADVNEEFYLVLDKKHSGKILEIYSTKIFMLESEIKLTDKQSLNEV